MDGPRWSERGPGYPEVMPAFDTAVFDIDGTCSTQLPPRAGLNPAPSTRSWTGTCRWLRSTGRSAWAATAWSQRSPGTTSSCGTVTRSVPRWESMTGLVSGQTRLLYGADDLLVAVGRAGLEVVLASSSIPKHAERPPRLLHAEEHADAWMTSEDAEESKPAPRAARPGAGQGRGARAVMVGGRGLGRRGRQPARHPHHRVAHRRLRTRRALEAGALAVYDDPRDPLAHFDEAFGTTTAPTCDEFWAWSRS